MYRIACVMGKSSTGKDHIYKALLENKELGLKNIVMYTTRPKRSGEIDGVEYYFVDDEKANGLVAANKVIELRSYNTVKGIWKYFTADDGQIDLDNGRYLIIGTLDVYRKFLEYFGRDVVLPIYIEVDDGIRLERALQRERKQENPMYNEMCRRYLADCEDFSEEKLNELSIDKRFYNNSTLIECIDNITNYIMEKMY